MWEGIQKAIANIFNESFNALSGGMVNSMSKALVILDSPFVAQTILTAQIIAGTLLGIKIAVDAIQTYIMHSHGEATDPGGLLIRAATSAAAISSVPWITKTVYSWGTEVAMAVANVQSVEAQNLSPFALLQNPAENPAVLMLIAGIIGLFIWALILVQTGIRAVELSFLAVAGPIMSVGLTSPDKGLFSVWWKELIVICLSQASQVFLIKGAMISLTMFSFEGLIQFLFFIGWLWVAYKSPSVLRQFAYSTGMGGAVGGATQQVGTLLIMRRMFTGGAA